MSKSDKPAEQTAGGAASAWSALFSEPMSELVERYTASVGFDQRLARQTSPARLAHAKMLAARRIIGRPTTWRPSSAAWPRSAPRSNAGTLRMEARSGGRAPEHRGGA
jgi:hypothetical protein